LSRRLRLNTVTVDGRTLDVYVEGPEDAVPLLFHNGTPSSGQLYAPLAEAASQRGPRMVSFSRAGYGSSTRNPGRSVADVIPDVTAVLEQLGASPLYSRGWSGGARMPWHVPPSLIWNFVSEDWVIAWT
jgi:pimeloyl-ACP methyl ester carboxylesterase